jgi:hypothetical protein
MRPKVRAHGRAHRQLCDISTLVRDDRRLQAARMSRIALCLCALVYVACSGTDNKKPESDASVPGEDAEIILSDDAGPGGICSTCGGCEETRTGLSMQHVPEPVRYTDNPPSGGDHAACWSKFGVHEEAVPEGRWVHNLEHGAVVFLHNCPEDCSDEIAKLELLAKGRPFALVTPNTRLRTRFAVVAWGVHMLSDCVDEEAFEQFYDKHVDQAGESTTAAPPGGC